MLDASLTHRRLSYPFESCLPAELPSVSLSGGILLLRAPRVKSLNTGAMPPKIPGVRGLAPVVGGRKIQDFSINPCPTIRPSLRDRRVRWLCNHRWTWLQRNYFSAASDTYFVQRGDHLSNVESMGGCKCLACGANCFHDFVFVHGDCSGAGNSGGVQISGGSHPIARQAASMRGRKTALAIWVQFQVSRYCIP